MPAVDPHFLPPGSRPQLAPGWYGFGRSLRAPSGDTAGATGKRTGAEAGGDWVSARAAKTTATVATVHTPVAPDRLSSDMANLSRQSAVGSQQSAVGSRQSAVGSRQAGRRLLL